MPLYPPPPISPLSPPRPNFPPEFPPGGVSSTPAVSSASDPLSAILSPLAASASFGTFPFPPLSLSHACQGSSAQHPKSAHFDAPAPCAASAPFAAPPPLPTYAPFAVTAIPEGSLHTFPPAAQPSRPNGACNVQKRPADTSSDEAHSPKRPLSFLEDHCSSDSSYRTHSDEEHHPQARTPQKTLAHQASPTPPPPFSPPPPPPRPLGGNAGRPFRR